MKTIILLYPDYVRGELETYYFEANLLAHILPQNEEPQEEFRMKIGVRFYCENKPIFTYFFISS